MKIHHVLLFCFLSAVLCGRNVHAKLNIFTGAEGATGTIECSLSSSGSWKFFCKKECAEEDILVKTEGVRASNGRYSINYEDGSSGRKVLSVTITNLTKSDSGRYRFGLGSSLLPDSHCEYEARVTDGLLDGSEGFVWTHTEGENYTYPCINAVNRSGLFFCKDACKKAEDVLIETDQNKAQRGRYSVEYIKGSVYGLYVTIAQMKTSDTGHYRCGYGRASSPVSSRKISVIVIDDPSTPKPTQALHPISSSTPPQSVTFSTASSLFSDPTSQVTVPRPDHSLLLPVCVPLAAVLPFAVLLLYIWKAKKNRRLIELSAIYEQKVSAHKREATSDQDQVICTVKHNKL